MTAKRHMLACVTALTGLLSLGAMAQAQPQQQQPSQDQDMNRLHYDLRLNPGQEGAWQQFQQAYREDPRQEQEAQDAEQRMPRMTGPQRMDMAIHMAERDLDNMRRQGDALKAFYAQLSPQQQRTFDRDTLQPPDQGQQQGGYQGQQGGYPSQGGYQGQGNYPNNNYPPPRNY